MESLECPVNIQEITEVKDWQVYLSTCNAEQIRLVNLSHEKMKEWFEVNSATNWKRGTDKNGITVDGRKSVRGFSMMRCATVMPFDPMDIFLTLCDGSLRQSYDPNIEKTCNIQKICSNTYACYQKAKKILVISPRDFVIITYMH